jgi:hypothetical protein
MRMVLIILFVLWYFIWIFWKTLMNSEKYK